MSKLQQLLESRAEKVQQQRELLDKAKAESRELTPQEVAAFDQLDAEIESLETDIKAERDREERENKVAAREQELDKPLNKPFRPALDHVQAPKKDDGGFKNIGEFVAAVRFGDPKGRLDSLPVGPSGGYAVPEAFRDLLLPRVRNEWSVTGTEGDGAILVPPQYRTDILMLQPETAIVRPRANVVPAGDPPDAELMVPALDQSGTNGVYGGVEVQWIKEGDAKPDTTGKLREVSLTPYEVAATTVVTDKLLRNYEAAQAFIGNLLTNAMMAAEDIAFLRGDGTGKPTGVINAPGTIAVHRATANQISYEDIAQMAAKLYAESQSTAVWVANQSILPQLVTIRDAVGNYIFIRGDATRGIPNTLMGMPVVFTGRTATLGSKGDLILADFTKYIIKDGSGPFIAASPHVLFQQNKTMIKAFWNVDGKPWVNGPMTLEDGTTTVSPYVVLDVPSA
ncbi:hypothetical protein GCM10025857_34190 [Alicyclobacillus contaminans]|uniref:phage major capsid protein n=1 Tax=Alicyclobacillus contaminans TaxID=392016 RepID=UPI000425DC96|nr:phage major capsid protein [Alicyclobacillus contaminans]GMA52062.1 hypothetical protein GCM10025857_34190 [Alicyclobacillus contaminans]